jgi:iron(III) transport system permease protein
MFDRPAAAQLALCLLIVALVLASAGAAAKAVSAPPRRRAAVRADGARHLRGKAAWGALIVCLLPVFFGFLLPAGILLNLASGAEQLLFTPRYLGFLQNS